MKTKTLELTFALIEHVCVATIHKTA